MKQDLKICSRGLCIYLFIYLLIYLWQYSFLELHISCFFPQLLFLFLKIKEKKPLG